jgi:hypothetical protein
MSKVIVFCADGTWNGPGEPDDDDTTAPPTKVFKLFLNIAGNDQPGTIMLAKEQERVLSGPDGTPLQWTKYLHGVGDSKNFLVQVLGGTLGAGLIARIVRGYTFISRNYVPGDQIFIVGFSRGAYTARALAGMIAAKGLLDATKNTLTDKNSAYRLGSAVWYEYRLRASQSNAGWLAKLASIAVDLPAFLQQSVPDNQLIKRPSRRWRYGTRLDHWASQTTLGKIRGSISFSLQIQCSVRWSSTPCTRWPWTSGGRISHRHYGMPIRE